MNQYRIIIRVNTGRKSNQFYLSTLLVESDSHRNAFFHVKSRFNCVKSRFNCVILCIEEITKPLSKGISERSERELKN